MRCLAISANDVRTSIQLIPIGLTVHRDGHEDSCLGELASASHLNDEQRRAAVESVFGAACAFAIQDSMMTKAQSETRGRPDLISLGQAISITPHKRT